MLLTSMVRTVALMAIMFGCASSALHAQAGASGVLGSQDDARAAYLARERQVDALMPPARPAAAELRARCKDSKFEFADESARELDAEFRRANNDAKHAITYYVTRWARRSGLNDRADCGMVGSLSAGGIRAGYDFEFAVRQWQRITGSVETGRFSADDVRRYWTEFYPRLQAIYAPHRAAVAAQKERQAQAQAQARASEEAARAEESARLASRPRVLGLTFHEAPSLTQCETHQSVRKQRHCTPSGFCTTDLVPQQEIVRSKACLHPKSRVLLLPPAEQPTWMREGIELNVTETGRLISLWFNVADGMNDAAILALDGRFGTHRLKEWQETRSGTLLCAFGSCTVSQPPYEVRRWQREWRADGLAVTLTDAGVISIVSEAYVALDSERSERRRASEAAQNAQSGRAL